MKGVAGKLGGWWMAVLLLLAGKIPGGGAPRVFTAAEPGWTVMVCMIGSDLETRYGLAEADLAEMQKAVREDTVLLVMVGGAAEWSSGIPPEGSRLYRITREERQLLDTSDGAMTDPRTLERLLEAGRDTGSAYSALVFWDHGYGAVEGFGKDEQSGDPRLPLPVIAQALENSGMRERPLTVIGFDACLMAGGETVAALSPYADYLLASEETEPMEGWDYSFLEDAAPSADGEACGRAVIGAYVRFYEEMDAAWPDPDRIYTLTLVDLRAAGPMLQWSESFFADLDGALEAGRFPEISAARENALPLAGRLSHATQYDLADLRSLAESSPHLSKAAYPLAAAVGQCVVAQAGNRENLCGVSVYFPRAAEEAHMRRWLERMEGLGLPRGWLGFMADYTAEMLSGGNGVGAVSPGEAEFSVVLDDGQLALARNFRYYVLYGNETDGLQLRYAGGNCSLTGHTVTALYDRRVLALTFNPGTEKEATVPLLAFWIYNDGGRAYYYAAVIAVIPRPEAEWTNADYRAYTSPFEQRLTGLVITRDVSGGEWVICSAMDLGKKDQPAVQEEFASGRLEIDLESADALILIYPERMPAADPEVPWEQWEMNPAGILTDYEGIWSGYRLEEVPMETFDDGPGGNQYFLQIVMTDIYNRDHALLLEPVR